MAPRIPSAECRPPFRLKKALAAGTVFTSGQVAYEIVRVFNSVNARIRTKGTQAYTIDVIPLGPDADQDFAQVAANLANLQTQYTTGTGTAAVIANTESKVDMTLMGEGYLLVRVTWGGTGGTLNFVDLCQLAYTR